MRRWPLLFLVGCGSSAAAAATADGGAPDAAAPVVVPEAGPACDLEAVALPDHPTAPLQASDMGKNLRNIRGWNGRLYFGYGDLNANTGPIAIASLDPVTKTWQQHLVLQTESIERFVQIGNELWATCGQGMAGLSTTGCEYGSGDANHQWTSHDIGALSIHMMDVTERVPGEILLAGSSLIGDAAAGAFIWQSTGGGPFQQIFPAPGGYLETGGGPFMSIATMNGLSYAVTNASVWVWNGTGWAHARAPGDDQDPLLLDEFIHPVTFGNHIVFGTFGGNLWKFDGKKTESLGIRTFLTPTQMGFTEAPEVIFEAAEDHLLAVDENGFVQMTTDLTTWTCLGKAPADVRSVGAMDGVVYFGGADGHAYAYPQKSW